jgi:hypothetical protein
MLITSETEKKVTKRLGARNFYLLILIISYSLKGMRNVISNQKSSE